MLYKSQEDIIRNLKDAGCSDEFNRKFTAADSDKEKMRLLISQRDFLLNNLHTAQKKLSCMDYLIYQIKKNGFSTEMKGAEK
ncbi:MAG: hypothetical protein LUF26_05115 [Firmicutes bacterium]|nr:hypothetical protein [Bacillota bacterium]